MVNMQRHRRRRGLRLSCHKSQGLCAPVFLLPIEAAQAAVERKGGKRPQQKKNPPESRWRVHRAILRYVLDRIADQKAIVGTQRQLYGVRHYDILLLSQSHYHCRKILLHRNKEEFLLLLPSV